MDIYTYIHEFHRLLDMDMSRFMLGYPCLENWTCIDMDIHENL